MSAEQRIALLENHLAEMQGVVAVLLAVQSAMCIDRFRPESLLELKERIVSSLLSSSLPSGAIGGAESAVAAFLGAIKLASVDPAAPGSS